MLQLRRGRVLGAFADDHVLFLHLTTADDSHGHRRTDALGTHEGQQVVMLANRRAITGHERITEKQSPLLSRTPWLDRDQEQPGFLAQALCQCRWQTDRLATHSQIPLPYPSVGQECLNDPA